MKDNDDNQGDLFGRDWKAERDEGMERVERKAGKRFADEAAAFIIHYLSTRNEVVCEVIVNACKKDGIVPHDDRAFGPVFFKLSRRNVIEEVGQVKRLKGHGAPGARIWKLKK